MSATVSSAKYPRYRNDVPVDQAPIQGRHSRLVFPFDDAYESMTRLDAWLRKNQEGLGRRSRDRLKAALIACETCLRETRAIWTRAKQDFDLADNEAEANLIVREMHVTCEPGLAGLTAAVAALDSELPSRRALRAAVIVGELLLFCALAATLIALSCRAGVGSAKDIVALSGSVVLLGAVTGGALLQADGIARALGRGHGVAPMEDRLRAGLTSFRFAVDEFSIHCAGKLASLDDDALSELLGIQLRRVEEGMTAQAGVDGYSNLVRILLIERVLDLKAARGAGEPKMVRSETGGEGPAWDFQYAWPRESLPHCFSRALGPTGSRTGKSGPGSGPALRLFP